VAWVANRGVAAVLVIGISPLHMTALSLIYSILAAAILSWKLAPWLLRIASRLRPSIVEIPTVRLALGSFSR